MTPERWQQIRDLLHSAMRLESAHRSAYLDRHCEKDPTLRKDVDSFLAAEHEICSDFLESPALGQVIPCEDNSTPSALPAGTRLGPHEVVALLGAGGMGEVYRARDTRLGRDVALKVILSSSLSDLARRQRFQREARAISALQHPNICTLYDVGQQDGVDYLVMEYLEGETLSSRLAKGPLKIEQILTYGIEIASALDAAHKQNIIHRDLKPGNILITSHGESKVLDFGLAKLEANDVAAPAVTESELLSSPGIAIGTVPYMSPEQARGEQLDTRTDIFSFGTVLYEMATGKLPFSGNTSALVFKAILDQDPQPPSKINKALPGGLDEIIGKSLEKDPELRYQSAAELRSDLKRVKRDSESRLAKSVNGKEDTSPSLSLNWILISTLALLMITAGIFVSYRLRKPNQAQSAFSHYRLRPLTSTGDVIAADVSPDGRYLVYVTEESEQRSLWIQQLATSSSVRVLGPLPSGTVVDNPRFSPDGNYFYYAEYRLTDSSAGLYRMSSVGGPSVRITRNVDSEVGFSRDGLHIAFARSRSSDERQLIISNVDGSNEHAILTLKDDVGYPTWSPDGRLLAFAVAEKKIGTLDCVAVVPVSGGPEKRILHNADGLFGLAWLNDGSGLLLTGPDPGNPKSLEQLWVLDYRTGKLRDITNDLNEYMGVSLSEDAHTLVAVQKSMNSDIWVASAAKPSAARQISLGAGTWDGIEGLTWVPNGQLLYIDSQDYSQPQIWKMDRDGSHRDQLTHLNGRLNRDPSINRDGTVMLFTSDDGRSREIWRMDADGGNTEQITTGVAKWNPEISPDGKWFTYYSHEGLWKKSLEGEAAVLLSKEGAYPTISPDGRWIAFHIFDTNAKTNQIEIVAADGKRPPRFMPLPNEWQVPRTANMGDLPIRWTASGDAITYVRTKDRISNLWSQPVNGGPAKQLTNFTSGFIWRHTWSRDGKWIAFSRGNFSRNAVLLTDLR